MDQTPASDSGPTLTSLLQRLTALEAEVTTLRNGLSHSLDIQAIHALLDHYTALHDDAVFDLDKRQQWENLFCDDGVAIYPFGSHRGRRGVGEWAFGSVGWFERCQLLSANFDISFPPVGNPARGDDDGEGNENGKGAGTMKAHVRSNCIAQWIKDKNDLGGHFDEGGFYYWTLRKEDEEWKIESVHLTITWTTGEDPSGVGPKGGLQGEERETAVESKDVTAAKPS